MRGDARALERATGVLAALPPVEHAIAYGSAVLADAVAASSSAPALDVLLTVRDPVAWHETNMRANPSHYAPQMRLVGARGTDAVSRAVGVGAHYNAALADNRGRGYKYGVVGTSAAVEDLTTWKYLFFAGRMHKPHVTLVASEAMLAAQKENVAFACRAALLLLPETFSELEFIRALVRLSYDGDIRFLFAAEDARKIERIASGNVEETRSMYEETLRVAFRDTVCVSQTLGGTWTQDKSVEVLRSHAAGLPVNVLAGLSSSRVDGSSIGDARRSNVAVDAQRDAVRRRIRDIVRVSSTRQAFAALLSTSPLKAMAYVGAKFVKSAASRFGR